MSINGYFLKYNLRSTECYNLCVCNFNRSQIIQPRALKHNVPHVAIADLLPFLFLLEVFPINLKSIYGKSEGDRSLIIYEKKTKKN